VDLLPNRQTYANQILFYSKGTERRKGKEKIGRDKGGIF
jgi:hypothetical protein